MISALEATICRTDSELRFQFQLAPLLPGEIRRRRPRGALRARRQGQRTIDG